MVQNQLTRNYLEDRHNVNNVNSFCEIIGRERSYLDKFRTGDFANLYTNIRLIEQSEIKSRAMIDFCFLLIDAYRSICFSEEKDSIKKSLFLLDYKSPNLWVVPLNEILISLNTINSENCFLVFKKQIINLIKCYFDIQIAKEVLDNYNLYDHKRKTPLSVKGIIVGLDNIEKRNKYQKLSKRIKKVNQFDVIWSEMREGISELECGDFLVTEFEKSIKSMLSRNVDRIVIEVYNCFIQMPEYKISETKKLKSLYPLFQMILPHLKWPKCEKDFKNSDRGSGMSFEQYKVWQMRKFIFKR